MTLSGIPGVVNPNAAAYAYEPPSTGLDLLSLPKALLAYVGAFFAQNGVALPDRQYCAAGPAQAEAWDCEQLTVSLDTLGWGRSRDATQLSPGMGKEASVNAMRHGEWVVQLVRRHPTMDESGRAPSSDALEAAFEVMVQDTGILSQALVNFVAFPNSALPPGASVQAGAVSPVGPSGGYIGLNGALTASAGALLPLPGS